MQMLKILTVILFLGVYAVSIHREPTPVHLKVQALEITNSSGNVVWRLDGDLGGSGRGQMKLFSPDGELLLWVQDVADVGPRIEMFSQDSGSTALFGCGVLRQNLSGVPDVVSGFMDIYTRNGPEDIRMGVWSDREPRISMRSKQGRRLLEVSERAK